MSKKLLGALCAVLTFAAALAVVPLTAEPAEAHNCVETYGSNAYTYGSAPSANNGHGHFCGIRSTPKPKPPTTTAPPTTTTPPPDTTPPIIPKCGTDEHLHSYRGSWCHTNHTAANNDCRTHRADGTHIVTPCPTKTSTPDDNNGDDGTVRACQPWPNCLNNRDPKDSSSGNDDTPEDTTPDKGARGTRSGRDSGSGSTSSTTPDDGCGEGEHIHPTGVYPAVTGCHGDTIEHGQTSESLETAGGYLYTATGFVVCNYAGGRAYNAATKLASKAWSGIRTLLGVGAGGGTALSCIEIFEKVREEAEKQQEHYEAQHDKIEGGSTPREGGTAAARPQPDSDTSEDSDATEAKTPPTLAEIAKAQAARVPRPQLEAMKNQWRCANGFPSFCQ